MWVLTGGLLIQTSDSAARPLATRAMDHHPPDLDGVPPFGLHLSCHAMKVTSDPLLCTSTMLLQSGWQLPLVYSLSQHAGGCACLQQALLCKGATTEDAASWLVGYLFGVGYPVGVDCDPSLNQHTTVAKPYALQYGGWHANCPDVCGHRQSQRRASGTLLKEL